MPTETDKVIDGFPHPSILPITGTPDYPSIAELQLELNANAASVQSNLGNGQLGLLALTVSPGVYSALSAVLFIPPANPGPLPAFPARATGEQQANLVSRHAPSTALFQEYRATDNALKQQIIGCINKIFLRTLSDRITGYAKVTTRAMLIHLCTTYGRLSADDVVQNDKTMKEPYDPNQPIEAFIAQIEDAIALANAADAAYAQAQIILIAYNLIFQTGMFPEACRERLAPSTNC
jgi:hypothetical protein